jgi:hypothetical protein
MSRRSGVTAAQALAAGGDQERAFLLRNALDEAVDTAVKKIEEILQGIETRDEIAIANLTAITAGLNGEITDEDGRIEANSQELVRLKNYLQHQISGINKQLAEIAGSVPRELSFDIKGKPPVRVFRQRDMYQNQVKIDFMETPWNRNADSKRHKYEMYSLDTPTFSAPRDCPNYIVWDTCVLPVGMALPVYIAQSDVGMSITEWDALPTIVDFDVLEANGYSFTIGGVKPDYIRDELGECETEVLNDPGPITGDYEKKIREIDSSSTASDVVDVIFGLLVVATFFTSGTAETVAAAILEAGDYIKDLAYGDENARVSKPVPARFGILRNSRLNFNGPFMQITEFYGNDIGPARGKQRSFGNIFRYREIKGYNKLLDDYQWIGTDNDNHYDSWIRCNGNSRVNLSTCSISESDARKGNNGRVFTTHHNEWKSFLLGLNQIRARTLTHSEVTAVEFDSSPFKRLEGLDNGRLQYIFSGALMHPKEQLPDGTLKAYDTVFVGNTAYAWFDGVVWHEKDISESILSQ